MTTKQGRRTPYTPGGRIIPRGLFAMAACAATWPSATVEAQEASGQREQAVQETLPRKLGHSGDSRQSWEALGFIFGKNADDLFTYVTFPKGWKKQPTDHSMWTDIVDDKGRKRGSIFYKAASYDQDAFANLITRFHVSNDYKKPLSNTSVVDALGIVQFKVSGLEQPDWQKDRVEAKKRQAKEDEAMEICLQFLKNNFPDYNNPTAYWE